MTPKQANLLAFLKAYVEDHGYSPSYEEMAAAVGLQSKSGVHRLIQGLHEQGLVTKVEWRKRSILPVSESADHFSTAALLAALKKRGITVPGMSA